MIRNAETADCTYIYQLYNYYISYTVFTFEESEITEEESFGFIKAAHFFKGRI